MTDNFCNIKDGNLEIRPKDGSMGLKSPSLFRRQTKPREPISDEPGEVTIIVPYSKGETVGSELGFETVIYLM